MQRHPSAADLPALLATLCDAGVEFIIVGGAAAVIQGAPITTNDLDIVHRRTPENVARLRGVSAPGVAAPSGARSARRTYFRTAPVRRSMRRARLTCGGFPQRTWGVEPFTPSRTTCTSLLALSKLGANATK